MLLHTAEFLDFRKTWCVAISNQLLVTMTELQKSHLLEPVVSMEHSYYMWLVAMEMIWLPWKWWLLWKRHGTDMVAKEIAWLPWIPHDCQGNGIVTKEAAWFPWMSLGCQGNVIVTKETAWFPWEIRLDFDWTWGFVLSPVFWVESCVHAACFSKRSVGCVFAAVLGLHGVMNQVQYHASLDDKAVSGGLHGEF